MDQYISVLTLQLKYMKQVFAKRTSDLDKFSQSLIQPLFPEEPSAFDVFKHGVESLYWGIKIAVSPGTSVDKNFSLIDTQSYDNLQEQLEMAYDQAIATFIEHAPLFTKEKLAVKFMTPFGREMTFRTWFGINLHHTVGHVAQALRIQKNVLKHRC
jgi:hypothetical protein